MPTVEFEHTFRNEIGVTFVAGLDEAGRGAIAGPVVAAAVILPLDEPREIDRLIDVNDSKQLRPSQREVLYDLVLDTALSYGIGSVGPERIDNIGIIPANASAMRDAVSQLNPKAQGLLIDGRMRLKNDPTPQKSIIRGDGISLSIAAASVLAKVTRDRHMVELAERFPGYGFSSHKGYCTEKHVEALSSLGPCIAHRHTFRPIREPFL